MRARLEERFPLAELRAQKARLDPNMVLGNTLVDTLFQADAPRAAKRARDEVPLARQ